MKPCRPQRSYPSQTLGRTLLRVFVSTLYVLVFEKSNPLLFLGEYGLYYDPDAHPADDSPSEKEYFDINHTAPQHRQYLTNEGFGFGNPFQRQKQYQKFRAIKATESVIGKVL